MIGGSTADEQLANLGRWQIPATPIAPAERRDRLDRARALTEASGATALLVRKTIRPAASIDADARV